MSDASPTPPADPPLTAGRSLSADHFLSADRSLPPALAIALGVVVSLCVTGYTFMQSNQQVYLLEALRATHPETLARDWFTTKTLQYHYLYTQLTIALAQAGLLAAGCFVLHLLTVVALHVSWRSIVRSIGGDDRTYLLSVLLYHLSAGGLGLGVYQFLQDGAFLASNVASIGALAGLACWLRDRRYAAAICVGVAGAFHVNYALLLGFAWAVFTVAGLVRGRRDVSVKTYVLTSLIAMLPCIANLSRPLLEAMHQHDEMPLSQFVPLYIEVRHPHHFDARHWPPGLWLSFLWPIPFAFVALRRMPASTVRERVSLVLILVLALEVIGTTFAGIWFVNETLVKVSLFRFSIYAKLLTCVLTAKLVADARPSTRVAVAGLLSAVGVGCLAGIGLRGRVPASIPTPTVGLFLCAGVASLLLGVDLARRLPRAAWAIAGAVALPLSLFFAAQQRLGVAMPGETDPSMAAMCDWIRGNTPPTSLVLVPPHDSMFRLRAQRSTVATFKHVPQLSGEIVEWKRRLDELVGRDILTLPRPMHATLAAMADAYAALPAERLDAVAREFGCDYLLSMRDLGPAWSDRLVHASTEPPAPNYWLYRTMP